MAMEGAAPFKVNYIDLRGGRKAEDFQPVGVKVENTPGIGPPEQRIAEQDEGRRSRLQRLAGRGVYCPVAPDRLIGLGVIPWTTLNDALEELRHSAEMGLKGVMLGVFPSGKVYPTEADDKPVPIACSMVCHGTRHSRSWRAI